MPLASSQARLAMLIFRKYDLDLSLQFLYQHKSYLSNMIKSFMDRNSDFDPESKASRILATQIHQLNNAERELELRIQTAQKELEAVSGESEKLSQKCDQEARKEFGGAWGGGGQ